MTTELLREQLLDLNEKYFGFDDLPGICWSRGRLKSCYRRLTLGSYDFRKNEIRIHPLFREKRLEEFVLRYVIFHELLHYEDRADLKDRRRGHRVHHREFHLRERKFPLFEQAKKRIKQFMRRGF